MSFNSVNNRDDVQDSICFHCLEPIPNHCNLIAELDGLLKPMCCIGCKAAAEFISQRGLMKFYQHRQRLDKQDFFSGVAKNLVDSKVSQSSTSRWQFLDSPDDASTYVVKDANNCRGITLIVEGLYCSSCTWLIERALHGVSNTIEVQFDVDARTVRLSIADPSLKLSNIVATIAQLGYRPTVSKVGDLLAVNALAKRQRDQAVRRIVVAGFGMMQVMTYATASYFGGSTESLLVNTHELMSPQLERFFLLLSMLVATIVVFYSGKPFFDNALKDLRNKHLGMDVPVSLAIGAAYFPSVYQVLSRTNSHVYFDSAVMFVFFLSLGRYVEMRARHKLAGAGHDVQQLLPKEIEVQRHHGNQMRNTRINPAEIITGDQLQLRRGDIVPFDAIITGGIGQVDESLVTGESFAIRREAGGHVVAGSKLLSGVIMIESTGCWRESSMAKIQQSIQSAERLDRAEQTRNRLINRYFILAVLLLTAAAGGAWFVIYPERVFEVCLAMLIAACPCAFALAAPVGRSAAIHCLKRYGVLLTSNAALNSMLKVTHWCFDKTGTLTSGRPSIRAVVAVSTMSKNRCLQLVSCIEQCSDHVLAAAFNDIQTDLVASEFSESIGQGVTAIIDGNRYWVGKRSWVMKQLTGTAVELDFATISGTSEIVLSNDNEVLAIIQLHDAVRASASPFLKTLRTQSIKSLKQQPKVVVVSGDNQSSVKTLCSELGLAEYHAAMMPTDKADLIYRLQNDGGVIAMVGDGVNDAPVLATADVSIAMASGSEVALNNSDVILLNGDLENLNSLIRIAANFAKITRQNLRWALAYNAIALPLAASGFLTPWIAALGMSLSSLIVVLNALRVNGTAKPTLHPISVSRVLR